MAMSNNEIQITWAAANSVSVGAGSNATSDAFTFSVDRVAAAIQLKTDHSGTPAADDDVSFYMLWTAGDPDGAVADEYDTYISTASEFLAKIETDKSDPGLVTVEIPVGAKGGKLYATNTGTAAVTVSATINEVRSGLV